MEKIIIVAPHFPPSNLAAVHRTRLFAKHLPKFGWEPIVVTVHHDYYEEELDWDLVELVPDDLRIERVSALPTEPFRIVGNIGVRGFVPLLRRLLRLTKAEDIDFLYLPIPPHFAALLGRLVQKLRGVPYGIDYIDPWVQSSWHPDERLFNKHWFARKLAPLLEPLAVRDASLITGVAEGYYEDVLERNPHLRTQAVTAAMPYGGETDDHRAVASLGAEPYLFRNDDRTFHLVYAGALLPKAMDPLDRVFRSIAEHRARFDDVCFHFIGTGTSPDDPEGYKVRPVAEQYGLWESVVREHPPRIPYVDALVHQEEADAVFVLGSTEPHYTPSKVYQGVLAEKPIFAVLHQASTACEVVHETNAGHVLDFNGSSDLDTIERMFADEMSTFRTFADTFAPSQVDRSIFEEYSAHSVTGELADALNTTLQRRK
jgi:glycosyltransferase involved in cell wall biosynthesis